MTSESAPREFAATLREVSPPRAFRGYDEQATRSLLEQAAEMCESLHDENLRLRRRAEELETALSELQAASADREEPHESVARALLAVARSSDEMLDEARQEAERISTEARATAETILALARAAAEAEQLEAAKQNEAAVEQARRDAADAAAEARAELSTLSAETQRLLGAAADIRDRLFALGADPRPDGSGADEGGERGLLHDLQPRLIENTAAPEPPPAA